MKRRSFLLPIAIVLVLISGIFFLVYSVSADPYERAVKKGDKFMDNMRYYDAISQYSIAQQLNANKNEAYIKNIMALAKNNDKAVVRDILTNVNDCIDYCGEDSISPEYIAEICDILVSQENGMGAFDILNHIHYKLASEPIIVNKLNDLSQYASESSLIVKPDIPNTDSLQKSNNSAKNNNGSGSGNSDDDNTYEQQPQNQNSVSTGQNNYVSPTPRPGNASGASVSSTPKTTAKPQTTPGDEDEEPPVHTPESSPSSQPSTNTATPAPPSDLNSGDSANTDNDNT